MPVYHYECSEVSELREIAAALLGHAGQQRIFILEGEMGAGKTTLIKAFCQSLGVHDVVTSPTFTIMNEYQQDGGQPVCHFDFYRIKSESEVYDFGYEDYFYSGNYCFIEWPEKIPSLLPPAAVRVSIRKEQSKRLITIIV